MAVTGKEVDHDFFRKEICDYMCRANNAWIYDRLIDGKSIQSYIKRHKLDTPAASVGGKKQPDDGRYSISKPRNYC